jgi:hypothetical protein
VYPNSGVVCQTWDAFSDARRCMAVGGVIDTRSPGPLLRGGGYTSDDSARAGIFYVFASISVESPVDPTRGFRGARYPR